MRYLTDQAELEELIGVGEKPAVPKALPRVTVVYFTAKWCGACRSLNLDALESATPSVNWLKCDIDQNDYTAGYCGVRAIPSFLAIVDKKVAGLIQDNNTDRMIAWVKKHL